MPFTGTLRGRVGRRAPNERDLHRDGRRRSRSHRRRHAPGAQHDQLDRRVRRRQRPAEDRRCERHDKRPGRRRLRHGNLAGLASGHTATSHVALLANLSAGFSATGGFTGGKIGGGTSGGSAVAIGSAKCAASTSGKPVTETSQARGSVSALSSTSITVGGLTCAIPSTLAAKASTFKVGDRAEIKCSLVSNVNTLVRIDGKK